MRRPRIVGNIEAVRPRESVEFQLEATTCEDLLIDWLNELLYTFDTRHLVLSRFDVRVAGTQLAACASGEKLDLERHRIGCEVKAVTYHELKLMRSDTSYMAQMILDI